MEEQVEAGRTKAIGLSNYNIEQIKEVLAIAKIKPANLQVELHAYLPQKDLVDFALNSGITVTAYSPLGCPGFNKFLKKMGMGAQELPHCLDNDVVKKIADKYSKTPAQIVLRWALDRGIIAIPKSVTPKRVEENFNVFDFKLDDKDIQELCSLDLGEKARICDWRVFPAIDKHPDFPFKG